MLGKFPHSFPSKLQQLAFHMAHKKNPRMSPAWATLPRLALRMSITRSSTLKHCKFPIRITDQNKMSTCKNDWSTWGFLFFKNDWSATLANLSLPRPLGNGTTCHDMKNTMKGPWQQLTAGTAGGGVLWALPPRWRLTGTSGRPQSRCFLAREWSPASPVLGSHWSHSPILWKLFMLLMSTNEVMREWTAGEIPNPEHE